MLAAKPPDDQHPYGHGRVEILCALMVGMMLIASGTLISFRSLERAWELSSTRRPLMPSGLWCCLSCQEHLES